MPSAYIVKRPTRADGRNRGRNRYLVRYRLGGRETAAKHGGSFLTEREARRRRDWIAGELASGRVPNLALLDVETCVLLRDQADRWKASRVDASEGTRQTYTVAINRLDKYIGDTAIDKLDSQAVGDLVAALHVDGLRKQTIRKTVSVLAMVLDHAGVAPNPARSDKSSGYRIRLPHEDKRHVEPPTAAHLEAVIRLLPSRYVLAVLVLDATGMRVGELEALTWGDVDEPAGRWRVAASVAKTGRARWVDVEPHLFAATMALVPRDDRHPDRRVFEHVTGDRLRTQLQRSCTAAGVPTFSPHDLRHRRVSLLHAASVPLPRICEFVGHDDMVTNLRVYAHVVTDRRELDYERLFS
jgi:integrase